MLEALALREEPPEEADLEDETLPDFSAELVQPFKASVGTGEMGEGTVPAAMKVLDNQQSQGLC